MEITKETLKKFICELPIKVKKERESIVGCIREEWDKCARKRFWKILIKSFCQTFGVSEEEAREYVYVEGCNSIPSNKRGKTFFGSRMYPDAAIISPEFSAAIELDHGSTGSRIRNALAKASFFWLCLANTIVQ